MTRIVGPQLRADRRQRLSWLGLSGLCGAVLTIALLLQPDSRGLGTHRQLGSIFGAGELPPCSWPLVSGMPCPTCGMTTAFANTVRGRLIAAWFAQPAGMILCLGALFVFVYGLYVAVSGRRVWINWDRIGIKLMLGLGLLIMGGWGFKMAYGLLTGALPMN